MSAARVKICGVTKPEDARVAAECGAWAVGLIFYAQSPRFVTNGQARAVIDVLPASVLKVGVFMDASAEAIRCVEKDVPLDLIQIHGRGAAALARDVGGARAVLAVALGSEADVAAAADQTTAYVLVDRERIAGVPSQAPVNRGLAGLLSRRRPGILLAGALTPETVEDAIREVRPWGVDVSGGVESIPGVKSHFKIRNFIKAVGRVDA